MPKWRNFDKFGHTVVVTHSIVKVIVSKYLPNVNMYLLKQTLGRSVDDQKNRLRAKTA